MADPQVPFNRGVIRPVECISEAWEMVKGNYWLLLGISLVGHSIASFVPLILWGPLMCGIYMCMLRQHRGKAVTFEMLFKGFDYFLQSLIATLITMLPLVILILIAYGLFVAILISAAPGGGRPNPNAPWAILGGMGLFYLFIFAVVIIFQVLFSSSIP